MVKDVELAYLDYPPDGKMLEVYTDASGYSMGDFLMQDSEWNGREKNDCICIEDI